MVLINQLNWGAPILYTSVVYRQLTTCSLDPGFFHGWEFHGIPVGPVGEAQDMHSQPTMKFQNMI